MANARHDKLIQEIGRAGVHALFPNDFEFYIVMFELVDSTNTTIDFLSFPVAPERLTFEDPKLVNIKKTLGGISSIDTETFNPKTIVLSGTFGRKFKLLLSKPVVSEDSSIHSIDNGVFENVSQVQKGIQIKRQVFDPKLKTGYGTLKVLEAIVNKSTGLDENNEPYKLYFYNPTLNHNFWVKINKFAASQDRSNSNMMWRYDLTMTAIAPIEGLIDKVKDELSDIDLNKLTKKADKSKQELDKWRRKMNKVQKQIKKSKSAPRF